MLAAAATYPSNYWYNCLILSPVLLFDIIIKHQVNAGHWQIIKKKDRLFFFLGLF